MSALSITHFMIAHLQDGQYGNVRILKPETAQLMHKRAFANDPRLPAMALGFYEQEFNGVRVIGHGGDTQHMHTEMYIVPEAQVVHHVAASVKQVGFEAYRRLFASHDRAFHLTGGYERVG